MRTIKGEIAVALISCQFFLSITLAPFMDSIKSGLGIVGIGISAIFFGLLGFCLSEEIKE